MDEPPFALVCGWRYPLLIIAKGGSFSTVSTLRLYSSTSLACGFLYEKSGGSHDDTHHSGKKTCDRIAEENGVSRASVLRARHYTKGVDIADTDIPSPRKTAILFNWMTSSSENTL